MTIKKLILLVVFLIIVFGQPVLAAEPPFNINLEVNEGISITEHRIEAEGKVVINLEEGTIKANKVVVLLDQKLIQATGDVVLIQGQKEVSGTSLTYNYQTQEGKMKNSLVKEDRMTFKGRTIEIKPETLEINDTSLTPCIQEDPHYKLTANQVTVYPGDKLVATGVWFWVKDIPVMPLFTYKMELKEEGKEEWSGDRASFPEPGIGYNKTDGLFGTVTYHHYVNEMLKGQMFGKYTENDTHRFKLDYTFSPGDYLTFRPRLDYYRQYGWDYYGQLKNEVGPLSSDLEYNSYIEKDEEEDNYEERKWKGKYQLGVDWKGFSGDLKLEREAAVLDANKKVDQKLNLKQTWRGFKATADLHRESYLFQPEVKPETEAKVEQKYTLRQDWLDYYWELKQSKNQDVNYRPQLTLGMKNKQLGANRVTASLKTGQIYETDTDLETRRDSLELQLNRDFNITDSTTLETKEQVIASQYQTADNYQSYDVKLDLKQTTPLVDLEVNYQYYDEAGATPFNFDQVLDDGFGRRYTVGGTVGKKKIKLTPDLQADWELAKSKTFYESGHVFGQQGAKTGLTYRPNDYNKLTFGYDYRELTGKLPGPEIDREADNLEDVADEINFVGENDLQISNEVTASYSFQTNQTDWPYWKVKTKAGYDLLEEEMSTLEYSATREYDCFNFTFNFDQLEEEVNLDLSFKY